MIAIHVNNEVPRSFGIEPKLLQLTQAGILSRLCEGFQL